MVIGPTPPGTGVIAPATSHRGVEVDVADELAVRRMRLMPTSITVGARLDPVALDHLRPADGGDQHVGAPADRRQIAGARVGDGHGGVRRQQQLRHRLADEVRAADDHRVGAVELRRAVPQQQHAAERRAGQQPG